MTKSTYQNRRLGSRVYGKDGNVEPYLTSIAIDNAAIEKASAPEGWLPYHYYKGEGVIHITGCMTRPKKSGRNKGEPRYLQREGRVTVAVTVHDVERHKQMLLEQALVE